MCGSFTTHKYLHAHLCRQASLPRSLTAGLSLRRVKQERGRKRWMTWNTLSFAFYWSEGELIANALLSFPAHHSPFGVILPLPGSQPIPPEKIFRVREKHYFIAWKGNVCRWKNAIQSSPIFLISFWNSDAIFRLSRLTRLFPGLFLNILCTLKIQLFHLFFIINAWGHTQHLLLNYWLFFDRQDNLTMGKQYSQLKSKCKGQHQLFSD